MQDDAVATPQDTAVTFDVLANDDNIDGQIVRASIELSSNAVVLFGTLAANADHTFTYTPDPGYVGADRFAYTVADDAGDRSAEARVDISVTSGNPPIANPDVADTLINQPVDVFVALNDDGNGFLLDVDSTQLEAPPANGTAVVNGSAITYTPDRNFTGVDTFTYSIANAALQRSLPATVIVTVNQLTNTPPVANDDSANTVPGQPVVISLTANDTDSDGQVDPATIAITTMPTDGSVTVAANGEARYTPDAEFVGTDQFTYTVDDNGGETSNVATVTVNISTYLGADLNPVDNISAAELQFLVRFAGRFVSQGIGGFFGLNHASSDALSNLEQIGDYTWLFGVQGGDQAPNDPFVLDTELQSGTATYTGFRYEVSGFQPLPVFNATGGIFSVTSSVNATINDSIGAPNAPLLDANAQPVFVRGAYDGLATVVQYPDAEFTHMLVRFLFVPRPSDVTGPIGLIARIPKEAMQLDANGMRFREIADATVRAELGRRGLAPVSGVAVVFYNQAENTRIFQSGGGTTFRPVPIAAGKGFSIPAHQLVGPPARCQNVAVNVRCQGGSNTQLIVTNSNGDISAHSPDDGSLPQFLVGGDGQPPNFTVGRGEHTVQDPASNCLLITDSREPGTNQGAIHRYDTDGTLLQANFIVQASGPGDPLLTPRGMAFFNGDLYVATEGDGRVLRFNATTGEIIDEYINDPGIAPRDIEFLPNGDTLLTDTAPAGTNDRVLLYSADGSAAREIISAGLGSPYQLSMTNDLNLVPANFSLGQIRFFNDGTPQLLDAPSALPEIP